MTRNDVLYIYSNGKAAAVSKKDGSLVWEAGIRKQAGMSARAIGQITVEDDKLFICTGGVLICLAAKDGAFMWKNELKGWGYNFISIANTESSAASAALFGFKEVYSIGNKNRFGSGKYKYSFIHA